MSDASELSTYVQTAVDPVTLKDLTNQRDPSADGINSAVLLQACTAGIADFHIRAKIAYQADIPAHVEIACNLACAVLCKNGFAWTDRDEFIKAALEGIAGLTSAKQTTPQGQSAIVVETEPTEFDFPRSAWDGYVID